MIHTTEIDVAIEKKAPILVGVYRDMFDLSETEYNDLLADTKGYAEARRHRFDPNKGSKPETFFAKLMRDSLKTWASKKCTYGCAYGKVRAKKVSRVRGSGRAYWLSLSMDSFLADFSPRCQRVARLYMAGYDLEDMPEILGKSLSTIKRDWAHIKAMFKNKWKGQTNEER